MKTVIIFTKAAEACFAEDMVANLQCGCKKEFVTVSSGFALMIDLDKDKVEVLKTRSDAVFAFLYGEGACSKSFHVVEAEPA